MICIVFISANSTASAPVAAPAPTSAPPSGPPPPVEPVVPVIQEDPATAAITPGRETIIEIQKGKSGLGLSIVGGADTLLVSQQSITCLFVNMHNFIINTSAKLY